MTVAARGDGRGTGALETPAVRGPTWAAHAAAVWAFAFAGVSCYWAAGGTVGLGTLGGTIESLVRGGSDWFLLAVWVTSGLKAAAGMLALALVRPWAEPVPRWLLLTGSWGAGAVMTGYALANLGSRGLQALGIIATPASMYSTAAWWHLLLWDPWWLLGGVLFLIAAWHYTVGAYRQS